MKDEKKGVHWEIRVEGGWQVRDWSPHKGKCRAKFVLGSSSLMS